MSKTAYVRVGPFSQLLVLFRIFAADSKLSKLECSMTQVGLKREHTFKNTLKTHCPAGGALRVVTKNEWKDA